MTNDDQKNGQGAGFNNQQSDDDLLEGEINAAEGEQFLFDNSLKDNKPKGASMSELTDELQKRFGELAEQTSREGNEEETRINNEEETSINNFDNNSQNSQNDRVQEHDSGAVQERVEEAEQDTQTSQAFEGVTNAGNEQNLEEIHSDEIIDIRQIVEGNKDAGFNETDKEEGAVKTEDNLEEEKGKGVFIPNRKIVLIKKLLNNIKDNNDQLLNLFKDIGAEEVEETFVQENQGKEDIEEEGEIIEGVFDGENMIGPDGKQYTVPTNYASKSKLVEGDILKLTIAPGGNFVYKQINPIQRDRVVGELKKREDGTFVVKSEGRKWNVLIASVTYFKGEAGDEVVLLVPKDGDSKWGAIENIIKK